MGDGSTIEWLDRPGTKPASWNPIRARRRLPDTRVIVGWHCEHVTEACRNCYAERQNEVGARGGTRLPYKPGHRADVEIYLDETTLLQPLHWKAPRTIFVCSMTDLYGAWVENEWLDKIKAVQALTPQHTYIELTKRPERMREYLSDRAASARVAFQAGLLAGADRKKFVEYAPYAEALTDRQVRGQSMLPNAWLGASCCDQADADKFIPILLETPAAIRHVSLEPLLGPIDLTRAVRGKLDWVIVGGESGPHARPMHPDWARSLRDQCQVARTPFFFKQWGEYLPVGQCLPGCGKIHGATAVKPGRMKLHYTDASKQEPKYAFAERGIEFASMADDRLLFRVGKKAAGRLLDGREWNQWPEVENV